MVGQQKRVPGMVRAFGSQWPSRNGTYHRFSNTQDPWGRRSNKPPIWQSRRFWYVTGTVGVGGTVYYQAHIEESPTGRRRFINISRETEVSMGAQSYRQVLAQYGKLIVPSGTPVDRYVQRIAQRVIAATGMDADWEVHVIESPERNAFVLPGGKIFVFSGILHVTESEDGLATVLAHEIAHQYARHTAEQMSRQMLVTLALVVASLFVDPSVLDLGRATGKLLLDLPNSRDCESEADRLGLMFMAAACYDPRQAVGFWERMRAEEKVAPPQFLSTHPSSGSRIDNIRQWLPEAMDKRNTASCPDPLLTDSFFSRLGNSKVSGWA
ncbi:metalloendopeptidase [Coemansia sp. RSA 1646]|nr:metalloendopeptidase [Coemansia sp. RSA 1646]